MEYLVKLLFYSAATCTCLFIMLLIWEIKSGEYVKVIGCIGIGSFWLLTVLISLG
jgi:hypothetical protein